MSAETIEGVVSNLLAHSISPDKMLAVVEQATTPFQQVHVVSLLKFEKEMQEKKFISPSLIIVGKVVQLHEQFGWLANSKSNESYFEEVSAAVKNLIINQKESAYAGRA